MAQTIQTFVPDLSNHQTLEDFEKEQAEIQAQFQAQHASTHSQSHSPSIAPPLKRAKKHPDIDRLLAEQAALDTIGDTNWVGKLGEYHQSKGLSLPVFTDLEVSLQLFTCTLNIAEAPDAFSSILTFSRKKDAKQFAAKLAIDWLISRNLMPANGSGRFTKAAPAVVPMQTRSPSQIQNMNSPLPAMHSPSPTPPFTSPPPSAPSPSSQPDSPSSFSPTSYAAQVPALCMRLGFSNPSYKIIAQSGTAFYSGWAVFDHDSRIEGKVGEFMDVYGKKQAKEVCARGVLSFLRRIERERREVSGTPLVMQEDLEQETVEVEI